MANTFKIRKSESTPIGVELPDGSIVEVKAKLYKVREVDQVKKQEAELDKKYSSGKMEFPEYMIGKMRLNVEFDADAETKIRELEIQEMKRFAKLTADISSGEHEQEKKPE